LENEKKFQKLHLIALVFGEEREISEIAYDRPHVWIRERNFRNCI